MTARKISPFGRNDNAELERLDDEALVSLGKVHQLFGDKLNAMIEELNETLEA